MVVSGLVRVLALARGAVEPIIRSKAGMSSEPRRTLDSSNGQRYFEKCLDKHHVCLTSL